MFRRDLVKGLLGGAAAVAVGEMFGRKADAAIARCATTDAACKTSCSPGCKSRCNNIFNPGPRCASCDICDYGNCEAEVKACGETCSLACLNACGRVRGRKSNCAECEVCWPPEPSPVPAP